jgi:hypothetical protein
VNLIKIFTSSLTLWKRKEILLLIGKEHKLERLHCIGEL